MQESAPKAVEADSAAQVGSASRKAPWRIFIIGLLLVGGVIGAMVMMRAGRLPLMSRADFDAGKGVWQESKPSSYKITVEVKGMQPGVYDVVVENGIASSARFDGRDLTRQRTFGTWSVTGMFDTLARDLETNDKHDYLMLRAEFDPQYGYPTRYERIEMRTGVHDALQWEVTSFEATE